MAENTNLNVVTAAKFEAGLSELWLAMKQFIHDETIDAELHSVIMARLAALINKSQSYEWQNIIAQVQYLEEFKGGLQEICEEKGLYVSDLELMQWLSAIRMAIGVFGCYIYAVDENDTEHFYTAAEWEILKTRHQQEGTPLPLVYGGIVNNSSATRIVAFDPANASRAWGTYGVAVPNLVSSEYDGDLGTKRLLQYADPLVSAQYMHDVNSIIVHSYDEIDTTQAPSTSCVYIVVESRGETVAARYDYINRGTAANPLYEYLEGDDPLIGQTIETFACTSYYWNGTTLTKRHDLPYKDTYSTPVYGCPVGRYCAMYKPFLDCEYVFHVPTQSELSLVCSNYNELNTLKKAVLGSSFPLPSGYTWSCLQYNNVSASYTSLPAGSTTANLKSGSYVALPVAAFKRGLAPS